jgi:FKBP-type peptidyl-prolyl cis-trans isomerase
MGDLIMKLKWMALLGFGLVMHQTYAAQPIVIDNQQLGQPPAAAKPDAQAQQPSAVDSSDAARERARTGARVSPREKAALARAAVGDSNRPEGLNFLAANKAKKGVVVLPSGVQYKILRVGKGKKPKEENTIMCRFKGTLTDGTTFDKTDEKKPSPLNVSGFLPGLKEAVKLMPSGSKWEIVIPSELAYGAHGNRGVGANAVVIYQMEIVGIK